MNRGLNIGGGSRLGGLGAFGVKGAVADTTVFAAPTITPSLTGGEKLSNAGFETFGAGLATSWSKSGTPTVSQEATIINGGASSQKIVGDAGGVFQQATLTQYEWYLTSAYFNVAAGAVHIEFANGSNLSGNTADYTTAAFGLVKITSYTRAAGADGPFLKITTAGTTAYFDDASLQKFTFSSLTSLLGTRSGDYRISLNPIVQPGTQAGVLVRYLDANNFIMVIVNRATNKVELLKRVAGVYTLVTSAAVTYADSRLLDVTLNGNVVQVYYNSLPVGVSQTIADSLGNDIYGFSTDASNVIGAVTTKAHSGIPYGLRPMVMFMFDDVNNSIYNVAFPYMASSGIKGVIYAVSDFVGTGSYCTWAQLVEMDAAGWDICNHSKTHTDFTTLTQGQIETELTTCKTALESHGLTKASRHVAYPAGNRNATSDAAMTATGMITGRILGGDYVNYFTVTKYQFNITRLVSSSTPLADIEGATLGVDGVVANKLLLVLLIHTVGAGQDMTTADFQSLVDYVVASGARVVTQSELATIESLA